MMDNCILNVTALIGNTIPMLLKTSSKLEFIYPDKNLPNRAIIDENEKIRMACASESHFSACVDGQLELIPGTFVCPGRPPQPMVKATTQGAAGSCPSNVDCYQIGFQLNIFEFIPMIKLIYVNPSKRRPLWAQATIIPYIEERQGPVAANITTTFLENLSVKPDQIFNRAYQIKRFQEIAGMDVSSTYFNDSNSLLVEGYLIGPPDFFYRSQQTATRFAENVMPMWNPIVKNNWALVGNLIRNVASDMQIPIEIWVGGMGVMTITDSNGNKKELYLAKDQAGNNVVPVPKLMFTYVYDKTNNRGLVLITVNDPYIQNLEAEHKICKEHPVCRSTVRFLDFSKGYTYCCTLEDFSAVAKSRGLPVFPNAKSLI